MNPVPKNDRRHKDSLDVTIFDLSERVVLFLLFIYYVMGHDWLNVYMLIKVY